MINRMLEIKSQIRVTQPLIHCITNPISINDCANVVLAAGARPIMAEHPDEVEEITLTAGTLAVNLGNITDVRMKSMMLSGKIAAQNSIPSIIDAVGVGCSKLRLEYAKKYIHENSPSVIKGNMSEIKALCGMNSHAVGIDAGKEDATTHDTLSENLKAVQKLSSITSSVVMVTGKIDIISNGRKTYLIKNGCEMMSHITGTGCMLNVLTASYISSGSILEGSVLSATVLGICGQLSQDAKGPGSFKAALLDNLYNLSDEQITKYISLEEINI